MDTRRAREARTECGDAAARTLRSEIGMHAHVASWRGCALLVATLLLASAPTRASACWDGFYASVGDVQESGSDESWDEALVAHRARWLGRIDALLPDGASVMIDHGFAELAVGTTTLELAWPDGRYGTLFHSIAAALGSSPAVVAGALAVESPVYVVQTGAFGDERRAAAQASAVDAAALVSHGFMEVGGFPATNPVTRVVSAPTPRTAVRVTAGAYLDIAEAQASARALRERGFANAFVRRL